MITQLNITARQEPVTKDEKGHLEVEDRGAVQVVRIHGGPHALFGLDIADQLEELIERVDKDPDVHAVVFTGIHPERFISHADVRWLQEGGADSPSVSRRAASAVIRAARGAERVHFPETVARKTPLWGAIQLDRMHQTLLRMNRSGVIFVAALNGSALGLGAEFAWACDLRVMADGNFVIGQPEVLFGIMPGGGGTQRLTRLVGTHRSLVAILEGKPFTPAEALALGAVDDVVQQDQVVSRAIELAEYFGSRSKEAVSSIKRAVYFGGSESLEEGLHIERSEMLTVLQTKDGQNVMIDYLKVLDSDGELPIYKGDGYARALETGSLPGRRPPNTVSHAVGDHQRRRRHSRDPLFLAPRPLGTWTLRVRVRSCWSAPRSR